MKSKCRYARLYYLRPILSCLGPLLAALIIALVLGNKYAYQRTLSNEVVRLHIIANSDDYGDQAVKLKVRDAILGAFSQQLSACQDSSEAIAFLNENSESITAVARNALSDFGRYYGAVCEVSVSDFPERVYGDKVYPAGEYTALKVVLGEGDGQNWWCVAFPPLCSEELSAAEAAEKPAEKPQVKSVFYEWFKKLKKS